MPGLILVIFIFINNLYYMFPSLISKVTEAYEKILVACKAVSQLFIKSNDKEAGKHFDSYVADLEALKSRFSNKEYYVLVGGETKTGKSSIINALIGRDICAVDLDVATNITSIIHFDKEEKAVVHFLPDKKGNAPDPVQIGLDKIRDYSCEGSNPDNKLNVQFIEIWVNSPILESGIVLMDTPGLGSLNPKHAGVTYAAAAQADVILFTTTADHEVTTYELDSLSRLFRCAGNPIVRNVITKADLGDPSTILQKNKERIMETLRKTDDIQMTDFDAFAISTSYYTNYMETKDEDDLADSGMGLLFEFFSYLESRFDTVYSKHYAEGLLSSFRPLRAELNLLLEAKENPEVIKQRTEELKQKSQRLSMLEGKSAGWRKTLTNKILTIRKQKNEKIISFKSSITEFVKDQLEVKYYLDNPEELANEVTARYTAFSRELVDSIETGVDDLEKYLYAESGLKVGSDRSDGDADTQGKEIKARKVKDGKGARFFRTLLTGTGLVGVGVKIGTIFGPVGMLVGGLLGAIGTIFVSHDMKKREIEARAARISQSILSSVETNVATLSNTLEDVISQTQVSLSSNFSEAISKETKSIAQIIRNLQETMNDETVTANKLRTIINVFDSIEKDLGIIIHGEE